MKYFVFHSVESFVFPEFETKTPKNNLTGKQEAGVMEIAVAEQELSPPPRSTTSSFPI